MIKKLKKIHLKKLFLNKQMFMISQQVIFIELNRSNTHGLKRSYTEKYDDLHGPVLRPFISVSYTEKYEHIRRKKNDRLRSQYTEAIYGLRFSPYMIVLLRIRVRRSTIVIRDHVIRQNTVVYGGIRIP